MHFSSFFRTVTVKTSDLFSCHDVLWPPTYHLWIREGAKHNLHDQFYGTMKQICVDEIGSGDILGSQLRVSRLYHDKFILGNTVPTSTRTGEYLRT